MPDPQAKDAPLDGPLSEAVELGPGVAGPIDGVLPVRASSWGMLASLLAIHGLVDLYSGVWPIFKHHAGISLEAAGLIATVAPIFSWSLQPLFGIWADRGHMRACILWGVLLSFPMMFLGPMGHAGTPYPPLVYVAMFAIVFLSRMGQAIFHPAAAAVAGDLARGSGRSGMVAFFVATGWLGYSLNQTLFSYFYERWDQHTELLLVPGAALMLWAWAVCRPKEHNAAKTHTYTAALRSLVAMRRDLLPLFLTLSCMSCVEQGVTFLLPEFAAERNAPAWVINGGALMCFVAGTVTCMIPAGIVADRVGRKRVLLISMVLCLVVFIPLVLLTKLPLWGFFALLFVAGGMINTAGPLGVSIAQHSVLEHRSLVTGIMMGLTWTMGGIAPLLMGLLAPRWGVGPALLSLALFNGLALIIAAWIRGEKR